MMGCRRLYLCGGTGRTERRSEGTSAEDAAGEEVAGAGGGNSVGGTRTQEGCGRHRLVCTERILDSKAVAAPQRPPTIGGKARLQLELYRYELRDIPGDDVGGHGAERERSAGPVLACVLHDAGAVVQGHERGGFPDTVVTWSS